MKQYKKKGWQILMILAVLFAAACNKEVTMPEETAMGEVNFFFASTAVVDGANSAGSKGYMVLIDSRDSTYQPVPDLYHSIYPYIWHPDKTLPAYPRAGTEWIKFMRLAAGPRQLYLVDTAHHIVDSAQADLSPAHPTMVFWGDNRGQFLHIIAADPYTPEAGKIGIRIVNLSPFTGAVFVTLNKQVPAGLPASTTFMDHTGFIPVEFPAPASVNVKVYAVSDAGQSLARAVSDMIPGHAYTLLITGYTDSDAGSYTDPYTGKTISINTNFAVTVLKNF